MQVLLSSSICTTLHTDALRQLDLSSDRERLELSALILRLCGDTQLALAQKSLPKNRQEIFKCLTKDEAAILDSCRREMQGEGW